MSVVPARNSKYANIVPVAGSILEEVTFDTLLLTGAWIAELSTARAESQWRRFCQKL